MNDARAGYTVSFTINTCQTDARFLDRTVRHILRAMNYPFAERLITYDTGPFRGEYLPSAPRDDAAMRLIFEGLLRDGAIDRVDEVPWDGDTPRAIFRKYFDRADGNLRDGAGTPVYQYLYALERCTGDYVFHVDSDMLFHFSGARSWIDRAVEVMQQNPQVVMAAPTPGPDQATGWLERLIGRPIRRESPTHWILNGETVSTRFFLLDRKRFEQDVLPLASQNPGEFLEVSLANSLKQRKRHIAWEMNNQNNWAIHPITHGENFTRHLTDLIWAVENGVYPFRRGGNFWDMITDGTDIRPWLRAIRKSRRVSNTGLEKQVPPK